MSAYVAMARGATHWGSMGECIEWARSQAAKTPVKILRARAGERHARIVAEVTADGWRLVRGRRTAAVPKAC
jgi:hypothetical protein